MKVIDVVEVYFDSTLVSRVKGNFALKTIHFTEIKEIIGARLEEQFVDLEWKDLLC